MLINFYHRRWAIRREQLRPINLENLGTTRRHIALQSRDLLGAKTFCIKVKRRHTIRLPALAFTQGQELRDGTNLGDRRWLKAQQDSTVGAVAGLKIQPRDPVAIPQQLLQNPSFQLNFDSDDIAVTLVSLKHFVVDGDAQF